MADLTTGHWRARATEWPTAPALDVHVVKEDKNGEEVMKKSEREKKFGCCSAQSGLRNTLGVLVEERV